LSGPGSLFDSNVWVALAFAAHPLHAPARDAYLAASPQSPALFCRATQQSVLRLLTTDAVVKPFGVPTPTNHDALTILDAWMASPNVTFVDEPANLFTRWKTLSDLPTPSPKRWMDAYLAAFAMEANVALVSTDGVFGTFPGLNASVLTVPPSPASPSPAGT
jgi:toxin-antitoxin system PIN domain toxin